MSDREKLTALVRLINEIVEWVLPHLVQLLDDDDIRKIAKHLIANGVTVREQGEWLDENLPLAWEDVPSMTCSACGESWILGNDYEIADFGWKYCPSCGARMEGEA